MKLSGHRTLRLKPNLGNPGINRYVLLKLPTLLIPGIVIKEIRKVALKQRTMEKADEVTQAMRSGIVVPIDEETAISAADLFIRHKLPLASSVIYAVALAPKATLRTQDQHFEGLPQVKYLPKNQSVIS